MEVKLAHASIFIISFILLLLKLLNSTTKRIISRSSSTNYNIINGSGHGSKLQLPPGPRALPIIGNLHQLWGSVLPHRRLMELSKKHGPLMHVKLGEVSAIVVSSREAAREMMKTNDISIADRPVTPSTEVFAYGGQGILLARYGGYWRQIRKICVLELLSQKRVQSFRSIREEEVTKLVRSIYSQTSNSSCSLVNISQKISALTNDITTRAVMGSQLKEQEFFLMALNEAVVATAGFSLPDFFPSMKLLKYINGLNRRLRRNQRELDRLFLSILREREQRKLMDQAAAAGTDHDHEGLLDILLRIKDDAGLELPITLDGVKCVLYDIFGAGSETSTKTVEWAMAEMMKNPEVMNKAQSEVREVLQGKGKLTSSRSRVDMITEEDISGLKYLKLVIKETLRMHAPVPLLIPRESREPFEMMGYHVPARATILVNAWAIARDPEYWDDPLVFKPERFEGSPISFNGSCFEYIPFGAGRRVCPGIWFGLANIELPLAQLLYYFDWKLPTGVQPHNLDMSEAFGVTIGRKASLLLHPTPRIIIPSS